MGKKILGVLISAMFLLTMLQFTGTVLAGDEDNPEITDEEDDHFGPLTQDPALIGRLNRLGYLTDIENFDFLDITKGWFYEIPEESDYFYGVVKFKNFEFKNERAIYAMHWEYDGKEWGAGVHTHSKGDYQVFLAGDSQVGYMSIPGYFDLEKNTVTFKIPKFSVGNLKKGDILTQTDAWVALRLKAELLTVVLSGEGELIKDWAGYGRDYTIQYDSIGVPVMDFLRGGTYVQPGFEVSYAVLAADPNGNDLYYYIDWGDGNVENWIGPHESEEVVTLTHVWEKSGSYTVQAKAKDTDGYESEWATLQVSVTKTRDLRFLLRNFLDRHPMILALLEKISNIFGDF